MKKFLLYSSALVAGGLLSGVAEAACIQTPTCSSLGYTSSSSCSGGTKCPFGNAWNCTASENKTEINKLKTEISSMKTDITNIKNKITELENNTGSGKCQVGSILFSDKSCSSNLEVGKIPIGVVVYLDGTGHGQAIALNDVNGAFIELYRDDNYNYCYFYIYNPFSGLPRIATKEEAEQDFDSCGNTDRLLSTSSSRYLTVAKLVRSYTTEGTNAGDWCMPAAGILNVINKNSVVINNSLKLVGGSDISESSSSTLSGTYFVGFWKLENGYIREQYIEEYKPLYEWASCSLSFPSRPVIEF